MVSPFLALAVFATSETGLPNIRITNVRYVEEGSVLTHARVLAYLNHTCTVSARHLDTKVGLEMRHEDTAFDRAR